MVLYGYIFFFGVIHEETFSREVSIRNVFSAKTATKHNNNNSATTPRRMEYQPRWIGVQYFITQLKFMLLITNLISIPNSNRRITSILDTRRHSSI